MKHLPLLLVLFPGVSNAEVMDKEPSLAFLAATASILAVLAYLAGRRKPWWLAAVVPAALLVLGGAAAETMDAAVGPVMLAEAGRLYVTAPWVGLGVVGFATGLGLWRRRCAPNNSSKPTPLRGAA